MLSVAGKKILAQIVCICFITASFLGCVMQGNTDDKEVPNNNQTATIKFINHSSYRVDIYKNLNPDYFDPTTLVCSINSGNKYDATVYTSFDQLIGDTFYIRYKILLADSYETRTSNIYVDAQRDLSNISMVVESGQRYEKMIPQPLAGQLKFVNGYLIIQNQSSNQLQITRGFELLHKMNDGGIYLNPGTAMGYYEIPFPFYDTTLTINQLKAFGSSSIDFPSFVMKRNKKYSFVIKSDNTIEGPKEDDIVK